MSRASNPGAGVDNWRAKYQALLVEVEQRETQYRKTHGYSRGLQNLLGSWVQDDVGTLQATLAKLGDMLEQLPPPASLPVQLDAMQQKLQAMQHARSERGNALLKALSDMATELKAARGNEASRKNLAELQRKLRKPPTIGSVAFDDTVLDALRALSAGQAAFLETVEQGARDSGGLLSRMIGAARNFGVARNAVDDAAAAAKPNEDRDYAEARSRSESQPAAEILPESDLPLSDEVAAILLGLLARLEVPAEKRAVLQKLYGSLQNGLELDTLVDVLDSTVEVVVAALGRDQSEFESFLNSLDSKLSFFESFVRDLNRELGQLVSGSEQLDGGVNEQLQAIRHAFEETQNAASGAVAAGDVKQLQRQVFSNLDAVAGLLTEFSAGQVHYVAALEARLAELQSEVIALQADSELARQRIVDQRDKLLRDSLTGIANREAYELRLVDEYARWRRYKRPLSLVVADIDLFKQVNDTYGHAAGDKVLKIVAKIMAQQLRESDFVARYGGEEFVFLLPETGLQAAGLAVEKVRKAIEASPFKFKQKPVPITCSFGLAAFEDEDSVEAVFERADQAMYRAKRAGRNRFECQPGGSA